MTTKDGNLNDGRAVYYQGKRIEDFTAEQIEKKISDFWEEKGWSSTEMQENKK